MNRTLKTPLSDVGQAATGVTTGFQVVTKLQSLRKNIRKRLRGRTHLQNEKVAAYGETDTEVLLWKESINICVQYSPMNVIYSQLEAFVPRYLDTIPFSKLHVFHALDGLHRLPIQPIGYLSAIKQLQVLSHRCGPFHAQLLFFDGTFKS